MHIQIDQSGRLGTLTQDTALGFANTSRYGILIPRKEKRRLFEVLKTRYQQLQRPELKIFAAAVFLLIRSHLGQINHITIDLEYPGHEAAIKGMLLRHIRKVRPEFDKHQITFQSIGKRSAAHYQAYGIFSGKQAPNQIIKAEELLSLL
jgi:hypothetical protein